MLLIIVISVLVFSLVVFVAAYFLLDDDDDYDDGDYDDDDYDDDEGYDPYVKGDTFPGDDERIVVKDMALRLMNPGVYRDDWLDVQLRELEIWKEEMRRAS